MGVFLIIQLQFYLNQVVCVTSNSTNSSLLSVYYGAKQRVVFSPLLFNVYMDALVKQLKLNGIGCHVCHVCIYMAVNYRI